MALYMMQIKYTREAIKDIAESGSNREDAVRPLIEKMWWETYKLLWACRTRIQYCSNCGI